MKSALSRATIVAVLMTMLGCSSGSGDATSEPAPPATSEQPSVADIDRAWLAALERGDAAAVEALLDADFEWTNSDGRTLDRAASIASVPALAADLRGETGMQAFDYGHVTAMTSARPGARMMRVWGLRPEGWRALAVISTALTTGATPFAATGAAAATGDCENPCRTMPFTPASANAKAIAAIFQQLKMDEWHPNPESWAPYVLDDVYYVTATAQLSKADRLARLAKLRESGGPSVPGDPVVSMRILDLGDSALMTARHTPYQGGRPYHSVRVWAFRDGRWQLANTQQTVVADTSEAVAGR